MRVDIAGTVLVFDARVTPGCDHAFRVLSQGTGPLAVNLTQHVRYWLRTRSEALTETGTFATSIEIAERLSRKVLADIAGERDHQKFILSTLLIDNRINSSLIVNKLSDTISSLSPVIGSSVHGLGYGGPFMNFNVCGHSIICTLFSGRARIGVGVAHGWFPYGKNVVATHTEHHRVFYWPV